MRQPTPDGLELHWWRAALRGPVDRHDGEPECGFYKRRMVRGGPWVPARIFLDREICPDTGELVSPEVVRCEVDGANRDASAQWLHLIPISIDEYHHLSTLRAQIPEMEATMVRIDLTKGAMKP